MNGPVAVALVFIGCCSNVFFLEHLIRFSPGAGSLITFLQFVFISWEGFVFTAKLGTKKPVVPIQNYLFLVIIFFLVQVSNNYAPKFHISMPLTMVFRSGSLLASLVLGMLLLKKRYSTTKIFSVGMITVGISICTIVSSKVQGKPGSAQSDQMFAYWLIGIALLTFAVFSSSYLGIIQERIARTYGKHPRESLFYSHCLALPMFVTLYNDLVTQIEIMSKSEPMEIPYLKATIPVMWLYMLGNIVTQYVCIRSVYVLTTEYTSLTVTLVITLRKFISLTISVFYFKNTFTVYHWIGTALVFGGTLIFLDVFGSLFGRKESEKKTN